MLYAPEGCAHGYLTLADDMRGELLHLGLLRPRRTPAACASTTRPSASSGRRRCASSRTRTGSGRTISPEENPDDHRRHRAEEEARGREPRARRHGRRRLHGARASRSRSSRRCRACASSRSPTATPGRRSAPTARPGSTASARSRRRRSSRAPWPRGPTPSPTIPTALCRAGGVEAIIETTGDVESGARVALDAVSHGKHIILMNAETDAAVGPMLKVYADRNGAVYTYTDGDEPGVAMNLYRFVESIGYQPVLMGQIKGFLDRYRNPDTQRGFAEKHKQMPAMVASFADGSKLALESAIIGNATGFRPGDPGHVRPPLRPREGPAEPLHAGPLQGRRPRRLRARGGAPHRGLRDGVQRPSREGRLHEVLQVRRRAALHVLHALPPAPPAAPALGGARGAVPRPDAHARSAPRSARRSPSRSATCAPARSSTAWAASPATG